MHFIILSFIILLLLNYYYHWMLFLIVQSTLWVKKTCHSCLRHNFGKRWSFFFHCWPQ